MATRNEELLGTAIAGAVIGPALLDTLITKAVLTNNEAREVVNSAMRALAPYSVHQEVFVANGILGNWLRNHPESR